MHFQIQTISSPPAYRARNVLAIVQLTIHAVADHTFTVSGICILKGADAPYLRMPKIKDDNGAYVPFIQLSAKMKRAIDDAVLPAVEKWLVAQAAQAQNQEVSGG
jgi:DNA-binding cell septation regulator SpoVG